MMMHWWVYLFLDYLFEMDHYPPSCRLHALIIGLRSTRSWHYYASPLYPRSHLGRLSCVASSSACSTASSTIRVLIHILSLFYLGARRPARTAAPKIISSILHPPCSVPSGDFMPRMQTTHTNTELPSVPAVVRHLATTKIGSLPSFRALMHSPSLVEKPCR